MFVLKSKVFEIVSRLNNEIRVLKLKINDVNEKMNRMVTLSQDNLSDENNSSMVFFRDKENALYFSRYWIEDNKITIRVDELETSMKINISNDYATILFATIENNIILLCDIQMSLNFRNRGIGTFMLDVLKHIATKNKIKKITGHLSYSDMNDHGDRLQHFYTKNVFLIGKNTSSEELNQLHIIYNCE